MEEEDETVFDPTQDMKNVLDERALEDKRLI
jgi:hypothetical protein